MMFLPILLSLSFLFTKILPNTIFLEIIPGFIISNKQLNLNHLLLLHE